MKSVGVVTAKQFGFVYIGGVPYNPAKVKRFMNKGLGIKVQDIVIFDHDEGVLSYIKNAVYAEEDESAMVKEFVRASELKRAESTISDGVSEEMKKELSKEGVVITNEGAFITPAIPEGTPESPPEATEVVPILETEFDPELISVLSQDMRRQLSIILQSSLKIATEIDWGETSEEKLFASAIRITKWVDRNSTQILFHAERLVELNKGGK